MVLPLRKANVIYRQPTAIPCFDNFTQVFFCKHEYLLAINIEIASKHISADS